jgi:signal transduction histidine kinase
MLLKQVEVPVELSLSGSGRPLPPRIEIGLYRLAQEALTNIGHHASATTAKVELVTSPEMVQLVVWDNGQGFDPEAIPENRYGLIGMNERVKLLHGRLHLESSPGEGTRIEVVIPLKA